jgi:ABC-type glycerol-3-phosphate transport system substrate-binding protein
MKQSPRRSNAPPARSTFLSTFVSIMLLLVLSSCGGDSRDSGDTRKVIRISHWWGTTQEVWDQAIADFERTHRDIKVEQQVLSFNVYEQKILINSAAGSDVGDLIAMEDWFAQELVNRDFFVNLQPYGRGEGPEGFSGGTGKLPALLQQGYVRQGACWLPRFDLDLRHPAVSCAEADKRH